MVALTALVGVAPAQGELDAGRLLRIVVAMTLAQLAIGWSNDYVDRESDAQYQRSKPVPAGQVDARKIPSAAGATSAAALALAATLGWAPALCAGLGLAAGLAYNFALKSTPWSWAPFVVAFCVLPPFVWTGLGVWRSEFVVLYPTALPLTVAAHLANALPDVATDRASGRRSLVVQLGRQWTARLLALALMLPPVLWLASRHWVEYEDGVVLATLVPYGALTLTAVFCVLPGKQRGLEVWAFRLVAVAGLVFTAGWLVSVR